MIDFNYTILIQFANFLILLILLNFLLFKPVLKAIGKREKTIGSLFEKAESTKEEAKMMEKSYEDSAKEKKKPILEAKDATLAEARTASMHIIEKARTGLADELSHLRSDIERDSKKVYDTLKVDVERLSHDAAQKILRRSLS